MTMAMYDGRVEKFVSAAPKKKIVQRRPASNMKICTRDVLGWIGGDKMHQTQVQCT